MDQILHFSEPKGDHLASACDDTDASTNKSHFFCKLGNSSSACINSINITPPVSVPFFTDGVKSNNVYGIGECLLTFFRTSELCALKKLEHCQQELVHVQKMWNEDREARRWTIAMLQKEVKELQNQLKHQRYCNMASSTHGAEATSTFLSHASLPVLQMSKCSDLSFDLRADRDVCHAGAFFNENSEQSEGKLSDTQNIMEEESFFQPSFSSSFSFAAAAASGQQRQHHDGLLAYVCMLEERVERYKRLLWDADKRCDELRVELSRAVQEQHDIRCTLTERVSRLLCEKASNAYSHTLALEKLEETTGLLIAARAAERAALRQLGGSCGGDKLAGLGAEGRMAESQATAAALTATMTTATTTTTTGGTTMMMVAEDVNTQTMQSSERSRSQVAAATADVDADVDADVCGFASCGLMPLRHNAVEEELCALDCVGACDNYAVESLRRLFAQFLEDIEVKTHECRSSTLEAITCLREIMSLLTEDECGSESESDAEGFECKDDNNEWEKVKFCGDKRGIRRNEANGDILFSTHFQEVQEKKKINKKEERNDEKRRSVSECSQLPLPLPLHSL